jgi:hypothetical protein
LSALLHCSKGEKSHWKVLTRYRIR